MSEGNNKVDLKEIININNNQKKEILLRKKKKRSNRLRLNNSQKEFDLIRIKNKLSKIIDDENNIKIHKKEILLEDNLKAISNIKDTGIFLTTNIVTFIKKISQDNNKIPDEYKNLELTKLLFKITKTFLFNDFELLNFSIYLDKLSWDHKNLDPEDFLYTLGFAVKVKLTEPSHQNILLDKLKIENPDFYSKYSKWLLENKIFSHIKVTEKDLNSKYKALSRPNDYFCKSNLIDYNYIVEKILKMSVTYSENKANKENNKINEVNKIENNNVNPFQFQAPYPNYNIGNINPQNNFFGYPPVNPNLNEPNVNKNNNNSNVNCTNINNENISSNSINTKNNSVINNANPSSNIEENNTKSESSALPNKIKLSSNNIKVPNSKIENQNQNKPNNSENTSNNNKEKNKFFNPNFMPNFPPNYFYPNPNMYSNMKPSYEIPNFPFFPPHLPYNANPYFNYMEEFKKFYSNSNNNPNSNNLNNNNNKQSPFFNFPPPNFNYDYFNNPYFAHFMQNRNFNQPDFMNNDNQNTKNVKENNQKQNKIFSNDSLLNAINNYKIINTQESNLLDLHNENPEFLITRNLMNEQSNDSLNSFKMRLIQQNINPSNNFGSENQNKSDEFYISLNCDNSNNKIINDEGKSDRNYSMVYQQQSFQNEDFVYKQYLENINQQLNNNNNS